MYLIIYLILIIYMVQLIHTCKRRRKMKESINKLKEELNKKNQ